MDLLGDAGDEEDPHRPITILSIAQVTGRVKPFLPFLIADLRSGPAEVRSEAAWAIGELGPRARAAEAALEEAVGDPAAGKEASEALRKIRKKR